MRSVAAAGVSSVGNGLPATSGGYAFLDAVMDASPGTVSLLQSYSDQVGLFSTAFVYDNAVAVLAYLARRDAGGLRRAMRLGDAFIYAQENDPKDADGRLRQAYNVSPYTFHDGTPQPDGFVRRDGTVNIAAQLGFTGSAVGDLAWAGLALAKLAERTRQSRYLVAAFRIAHWIEANARGEGPLGGYCLGVDEAGAKRVACSTEHNIDLVAFFGVLARLTGDPTWATRRARAEAFVETMSHGPGNAVYTGTNDGVDINRWPLPADTQTWSYLALRSARYRESVDWAVQHLMVTDEADRTNSEVSPGRSYSGITFSTAGLVADEQTPIGPGLPKPNRQGVWFEGTAHLALALRLRGGHDRLADRLLASVELAQRTLGGGQTVAAKALPDGAGVVAASSPIDTGFGFGYYPYRHIGATAWYLLAAARVNPLG